MRALYTLLIMSVILTAPAAFGATITVNSNSDAAGNDGLCTLRDAINNANADSDTTGGDCVAGSGSDVITFDADYTIALGSMLPALTTDMTITGNGAANTIIDGQSAGTYRCLQVTAGTTTVSGVTIQHCFNNANGGAVWNGATLTLTDSIISSNTTSGLAILYGGGIYNNSGTLTITNSTISGNTTVVSGGGIYNNSGTLTITDSTISGNTAATDGGGLYNTGALTLADSLISDNSSTNFYGGGLINSGTATITGSAFIGNSAYKGGGGIDNTSSGVITITNSTISGNTSVTFPGGGIYNTMPSSMLTLVNSTVTNNSGVGTGGIYRNLGTITISNSIVADQAAGTDCSGTITSGGYNLESGTSCGFTGTGDIQNGIAGLGPLADNGGPTFTHALLTGSPAIDAGDCNGGAVTVDQRGVSRPQGSGCDIGAYEARQTITGLSSVPNPSVYGQTVAFTATVTGGAGTPTGTVDFTEGATTLCSSVALTGGQATCDVSSLGVGPHTITAAYSGDTNYIGSSDSVSQTVNKADQATLTLNAGSPLSYNAAETLTTSGGSGTGAVTYQVTSGSCTAVGDQLTANSGTGSCSVLATKAADANYNAATATATVVLQKALSTTVVVSSLNPSTFGQTVTFTATVTSSSGTPTGTVDFEEGATTLCSSVALIGGQATCSTSSLSAGSHPITAGYGGDGNYSGSTSPAITQTVYPTSVTIPAATGSGNIVLSTNSPGCGFTSYGAKTEAQVGSDPLFDYPYGLVEFTLNCPVADVTIIFPGSIVGAPYRKYGPTTPGDAGTTAWYTFTDLTENGTASVTLHLADGQLGDDTGVDGVIVDQGGPGQPPAGSVAVPTMTGWGMTIFLLLAGLMSAYLIRRRRA